MRLLVRRLAVASALVAAAAALAPSPAQDAKKPAKKGDGPGVIEVYEAKDGFRFRIKGADGKSLATSPKGFKTKADAEKAIEQIKEIVTTGKVVEGKDK